MTTYRWLLVWVVVGCGGHDDEGPTRTARQAPIALDDQAALVLKLSSGTQGPPAFDHAKLAAATPLADAEVQTLLARAKPIAADAADLQPFALRPASQPPPTTGQKLAAAFPPPVGTLAPPPGRAPSEPLRVLRWTPAESEVGKTPQLTVTFSQPMV